MPNNSVTKRRDDALTQQETAAFFGNVKKESGSYTNHTLVANGFTASITTFDFMPWIWLIGICFIVYVIGNHVIFLIGVLVCVYLFYVCLKSWKAAGQNKNSRISQVRQEVTAPEPDNFPDIQKEHHHVKESEPIIKKGKFPCPYCDRSFRARIAVISHCRYKHPPI